MCDGTPCPCNLLPKTPEQIRARRKRLERRADRGIRVWEAALGGCMAVIVLALVRAITGPLPLIDLAGMVAVALVMICSLVGLIMIAPLALLTLRERHRRAVDYVRREEM